MASGFPGTPLVVLVLVPLVAGLLIGLATGGNIGNLAHMRFRWPWFVLAVLVIREAVILANGARMPVTPDLAGVLVQRGHVGQYVLMSSSTNLNWLADWIGFPWPVRGAYSPGDLLIALGIGIVTLLAVVQSPARDTKLE